jgi:superfamily II DNA/RNA helicase
MEKYLISRRKRGLLLKRLVWRTFDTFLSGMKTVSHLFIFCLLWLHGFLEGFQLAPLNSRLVGLLKSNRRISKLDAAPSRKFGLEDINFKEMIKIDPAITTPLTEMGFSAHLQSSVQKRGFKLMTPIQSQSFQRILEGNDVIGRSKTGTGKTLAFSLPLIEQLLKTAATSGRRAEPPAVIILEPTRELADQVTNEINAISRHLGMHAITICGKMPMDLQVRDLGRFPQFIVATPGRLIDHIDRQTFPLHNVGRFVIDEADKMLEMGFQADVERIMDSVMTQRRRVWKQQQQQGKQGGGPGPGPGPGQGQENQPPQKEPWQNDPFGGSDDYLSLNNRFHKEPNEPKLVQTLLFSATVPDWVARLSMGMMTEPIFLDTQTEGETRLPTTISHYHVPLPHFEATSRMMTARKSLAKYILSLIDVHVPSGGQTIIFVNTKKECDEFNAALASLANPSTYRVGVIHGDISQMGRKHVLGGFRVNAFNILVASDVAARGLDIPGVSLVIHTNMPRDVDTYVHRSGRTGRIGRSGKVILLHPEEEMYRIAELQKELQFFFEMIQPTEDLVKVLKNFAPPESSYGFPTGRRSSSSSFSSSSSPPPPPRYSSSSSSFSSSYGSNQTPFHFQSPKQQQLTQNQNPSMEQDSSSPTDSQSLWQSPTIVRSSSPPPFSTLLSSEEEMDPAKISLVKETLKSALKDARTANEVVLTPAVEKLIEEELEEQSKGNVSHKNIITGLLGKILFSTMRET